LDPFNRAVGFAAPPLRSDLRPFWRVAAGDWASFAFFAGGAVSRLALLPLGVREETAAGMLGDWCSARGEAAVFEFVVAARSKAQDGCNQQPKKKLVELPLGPGGRDGGLR
jgi:hypothetical protein